MHRPPSPVRPVSPWECSACTFVNLKSFETCEICSTRNPKASLAASSSASAAALWACPACTFANPSFVSACGKCATPNLQMVQHPSAPIPTLAALEEFGNPALLPLQRQHASSDAPTPWNCRHCSFLNLRFFDSCEICREPKFAARSADNLDDLWVCPDCLNVRSKREAICVSCQTPRREIPLTSFPVSSSSSSSSSSASASASAAGFSAGPRRSSTWGCPVCTYMNPNNVRACVICQTPLPSSPHSSEQKSSFPPNVAMAGYSQAPSSRPVAPIAGRSMNHPSPQGEWVCGACSLRNSNARSNCAACLNERHQTHPD